jgi:cytochrome c-type biogenesis protein CcmE
VTSTISDSGLPPRGSTPPRDGGPALPTRRRRTSKRLWLVAAVLLAAFVFLLVEGLGSALNYFDTVDQAYAHRATLGTRTFNLEGAVVNGSIRPTDVGTDFQIYEGTHVVSVMNTGSPPQLVRNYIPVVVVGHFTSSTSNEFLSHQILVKHSPDYCAAHPNRVKAKNATAQC